MKETLPNDGVISMDEGEDENHDAATHKFKFWWSEAQSFYSKIMAPALKIGAVRSATLFCIVMFFGGLYATRWLDIVSFEILCFIIMWLRNHENDLE